MSPDVINALFEAGGGLAILISVRKLLRERIVRGVSWAHLSFFFLWGCWNIYYYPVLGQIWSFIAGLFIVVINGLYLALILHYTRLENVRNTPTE